MSDPTGSDRAGSQAAGSDRAGTARAGFNPVGSSRSGPLIEPELKTASSASLLAMRQLLAREILIFLAFLVLSMAAMLVAFDKIFAWSHTDNIRTIIIPIAAFTYAVFMLIWMQRTLIGAGSLLRIDDQLEARHQLEQASLEPENRHPNFVACSAVSNPTNLTRHSST
jgi:hypothetical protein